MTRWHRVRVLGGGRRYRMKFRALAVIAPAVVTALVPAPIRERGHFLPKLRPAVRVDKNEASAAVPSAHLPPPQEDHGPVFARLPCLRVLWGNAGGVGLTREARGLEIDAVHRVCHKPLPMQDLTEKGGEGNYFLSLGKVRQL